MAGFLFGTRNTIDASELRPEEAAGVLAYAQTQAAYQAAAADGAAADHAAIRAEIEALNARAAEALTSAEAPSGPPSQSDGQQTMPQPTERIAEISQLLRGKLSAPERRNLRDELFELLAADPAGQPISPTAPGPAPAPTQNAVQTPTERIAHINTLLRDRKMSSHDRAILRDELGDLLEAHPAGEPLPPSAPAPAPGPAREVVVTTPRGAGLTERSIALTTELRGMKYHGSSERQAKLAELAETLLDAEPAGEAAA